MSQADHEPTDEEMFFLAIQQMLDAGTLRTFFDPALRQLIYFRPKGVEPC